MNKMNRVSADNVANKMMTVRSSDGRHYHFEPSELLTSKQIAQFYARQTMLIKRDKKYIAVTKEGARAIYEQYQYKPPVIEGGDEFEFDEANRIEEDELEEATHAEFIDDMEVNSHCAL